MKNLQKGGGELIWIVVILVFMIGYGYISFKDVKVPPASSDVVKEASEVKDVPAQTSNQNQTIVSPDQSSVAPPSVASPALKVTWTESQIKFDGKPALSINDFPDEIQVSPVASFGSSDRIKQAVLSPDGKWLAIAVGGAAHDFGWVYEIAKERLSPVAFSYGGGVAIKQWVNMQEVTFIITSPKPVSKEVTVNVTNLPKYLSNLP